MLSESYDLLEIIIRRTLIICRLLFSFEKKKKKDWIGELFALKTCRFALLANSRDGKNTKQVVTEKRAIAA